MYIVKVGSNLLPMPKITVDDCLVTKIIVTIYPLGSAELTVDDMRNFSSCFRIKPNSCFEPLQMGELFYGPTAVIRQNFSKGSTFGTTTPSVKCA